LMVVGHKGVHQSDVVGLPCFGCVTRQHGGQRQQRTKNRRSYHDDMGSCFGYLQIAKKRILTRVATANKIVRERGTSRRQFRRLGMYKPPDILLKTSFPLLFSAFWLLPPHGHRMPLPGRSSLTSPAPTPPSRRWRSGISDSWPTLIPVFS